MDCNGLRDFGSLIIDVHAGYSLFTLMLENIQQLFGTNKEFVIAG